MEFTKDIAVSLHNSIEPFPVDFNRAWQWLGYSKKSNAKRLLKHFRLGLDYSIRQVQESRGGKLREDIHLSTNSFKHLAMMASSSQGELVRDYFIECEQTAKNQYVYTLESLPVKTNAEILLETVTILVKQEQLIKQQQEQINQLETKTASNESAIALIEQEKNVALEELSYVPHSEEVPPELTTRSKINMQVRNYVKRNHMSYSDAWDSIYRHMVYRFKVDLKARARARGMKPLDVAEQDGLIESLYSISSLLLSGQQSV